MVQASCYISILSCTNVTVNKIEGLYLLRELKVAQHWLPDFYAHSAFYSLAVFSSQKSVWDIQHCKTHSLGLVASVSLEVGQKKGKYVKGPGYLQSGESMAFMSFLPCLVLQCVNELSQWLSALRKVCGNNAGMLCSYHPGVFRGDKWSCCHLKDKAGIAFVGHATVLPLLSPISLGVGLCITRFFP